MGMQAGPVLLAACALLAAGCRADAGATSYAHYDTASDVVSAMTEAGYGCDETEKLAIDDEAKERGIQSGLSCTWPTEQNPDLPDDEIWVEVYETRMDRLKQAWTIIGFRCQTGSELSAYAYGDRWLVTGEDIGSTLPVGSDVPILEALAGDLDGAANLFDCSDEAAMERWAATWRSPDPASASVDDVQEALGEPIMASR